MQTFLPYPDFEASARCLDRARLGKQRLEALQILRVVLGLSMGWRNHPAVLMWWDHPDLLSANLEAGEFSNEWPEKEDR